MNNSHFIPEAQVDGSQKYHVDHFSLGNRKGVSNVFVSLQNKSRSFLLTIISCSVVFLCLLHITANNYKV